jgi:hypothetical protein
MIRLLVAAYSYGMRQHTGACKGGRSEKRGGEPAIPPLAELIPCFFNGIGHKRS